MGLTTILSLIEMATKMASGLSSGKTQSTLQQVAALEEMARKVAQAHMEIVGKPIDPSSLKYEAPIK